MDKKEKEDECPNEGQPIERDMLRRAAQLEDVGQKLEILDAPDIILVDVNDPVAVEEERLGLRGCPHKGRSRN